MNLSDIERIAHELGGDKATSNNNCWSTCCPVHGDKTPSLSLCLNENSELIVNCHAGCDWRTVKDKLRELELLPYNGKNPHSSRKMNKNIPAYIWQHSKPDHKEIRRYLATRGILLEKIPDALRWNVYKGKPMMVARLWAPKDGDQVSAIHRTYVDQDYQKAGRKMLGICKGKAVWLSRPVEKMLVGEGIETVLAAMGATGQPGISCLSVSGMRAVYLPETVKEIIILVDSDPNKAGQNAAKDFSSRFNGKIWFATPDDSCFTAKPKKLDFNDLTPVQIRERFEHLVDPAQIINEREPPAKLKILQVDEDGKRKTKGTLLVEIGSQHELFHDEIGEGYVTISKGDFQETLPVRSETFAGHLMDDFFRLTGKGVSRSSVSDATDTLRALARVDGKQHHIFRRTALVNGRLYIDLCDPSWRAVEVSAEGWKIVANHGVKFLRNVTSLALPEPVGGGNLVELWSFLNVRPEDRPLVAGFLVRALHPEGPYFGLTINGEQGTGKSTASKIIRFLVDPSTAMLRPPPKDERDFLVGAVNNWCITYDNLSGIQPWLSDALCRILTGGSFASRTLYSTTEETAIPLARPAILNGIDDLMGRPDLADRAIAIALQPIDESARLDERELWKQFHAVKGRLFGVLLDGLSSALKNIDQVHMPYKPRMVDAARWATAAEEGLRLSEGSFIRAYRQNQKDIVSLSLEASPFAAAIMKMVAEIGKFEGTPMDLLSLLPSYARDEEAVKSKAWPKNAVWMSRMLTQYAPSLRKIGIHVECSRISTKRYITLAPSDDSMTVKPKNLTPLGQVKDEEEGVGNSRKFQKKNTVITVIPSQNTRSDDSNDSTTKVSQEPISTHDGWEVF